MEAPYSGVSLDLAQVALESSLNFYLGKHSTDGVNSIGLDDLLIEVGHQGLDESIKNQFDSAIESLNDLGNDLAVEVVENQPQVEAVYNEVSKNVVLMKTDMPSILCVAITYIDNPSDSD